MKTTDATAGSPGAVGSAPLRYGQILAAIDDAPRSYLGGILACAVRACVHKRFFRDREALVRFVRVTIDQTQSPNADCSAGSTEPPQCGNRDSTAGNEDAKTVGPAQSPNTTGSGTPEVTL